MSTRSFLYEGRTIISAPDQNNRDLLYGYVASQTEAERIARTYNSGYIIDYQGTKVVLLGGYRNNNRNSPFVFPSGPANDNQILGGISNYALTRKIANDPNFYRLASGEQPSNTNPSNPNQPGTPGTSVPSPNPNPNEKRKRGDNPQPLTYPSDMSSEQDRITFQAKKVTSRRGAGGGGLDFSFGEPVYDTVGGGPVILAIQSSITDQNSVDWGPDSVNAIDAAIFNLSLDLMSPTSSSQESQISNIIQRAIGETYTKVRAHSDLMRKYLAGQAAGLNNVLARTDGVVLNPNMELLFQGPQLRPFSFQFKLSARNQGEANQIKAIINYFKKNMAVQKSGGLFLKAPHVFEIKYKKGGGDHPGINKIKECALTNCSVDYTPLGTYMTYNDGTMVAYTLSLQFQEITPVYYDEYADNSSSIGF